jgi:hypothetical protein
LKVPKSQFRSKLELAYANHLFGLRHTGEIESYKYEAVTFRLGHDLRYTPDFMVDINAQAEQSIEFHEVKGPFMRANGRTKLLACAAAFPMFRFYLVTRNAAGAWDLKLIAT